MKYPIPSDGRIPLAIVVKFVKPLTYSKSSKTTKRKLSINVCLLVYCFDNLEDLYIFLSLSLIRLLNLLLKLMPKK